MRKYLFYFVFVILAFYLIICSGCTTGDKNSDGDKLGTIQGVGAVDQTVIVNLQAFQDAEKEFEKKRKELVAEYSAIMKDLTNEKQKEIIYKEFDAELARTRESLVTPLMDKEKKIIEGIAKKEGLSVVVDSSLVVCGITDITDKVTKAFEGKEDKNETPSQDSQTKEAPKEIIGYLSQDKLYELKKMQDAQEEYSRAMFVMQEKVKSETKNLKDDEAKEKVFLKYQKEAEKKKDEIFKPIKDEINKIAEEICKSKGLIIILDKVDIFYGGVDITQEVMDKVK